MKIKKFEWIDLNRECLDAEVIVSDGKFEVKCFCSPCNFKENEILNGVLHTLDERNIRLALIEKFECQNVNNTFEYYMVGKLINKELNIIKIGEILIELFEIPNDINEGQFIEFSCTRIDIY